ncbi:MAG: SHOCT domain-containing protein [Fusobacteriota bacterium]
MCFTSFGSSYLVTIIWIALIALIAWTIFEGVYNNFFKKDSEALRILKKRYAEGEIDKKEFKEKRKDIK